MTREEVAARADKTIEGLLSEGGDKVAAVNAMASGVLSMVEEWLGKGEVGGYYCPGRGRGDVARDDGDAFPSSGIAQGHGLDHSVSGYPAHSRNEGHRFFPSVADILGLNPLLRTVLRNAASALTAMAGLPPPEKADKKVIGSTCLGITTPAVMASRRILEDHGYEMTCYHANGYGGRAFEEGVRSGVFSGVLDLTTHEITNQLFKGTCLAGEDRAQAAARMGIPQLVVPGAIDVISKGPIRNAQP